MTAHHRLLRATVSEPSTYRPSEDVVTGSQAKSPWRMRSHHFGRWEFVLRPYADRRGPLITARWGVGRWPGHVRLVGPWRVLGVVWVVRRAATPETSTYEPSEDVVTQHSPTYHSTTKINGHVIGEFMAPIPDPLARTTVTVGWRDLLRSLLTRRSLTVEVLIGADSHTATRLLELDPDYLGPAGSAPRTAWDASLNARMLDAAGGAS